MASATGTVSRVGVGSAPAAPVAKHRANALTHSPRRDQLVPLPVLRPVTTTLAGHRLERLSFIRGLGFMNNRTLFADGGLGLDG